MSTHTNTAASTSAKANAPASSTTDANADRYFDLHARGVGYLNRVRTVAVKGKGGDYLAVDVSALRGPASKVDYTHFGCRVSGSEAQRVINDELRPHIQSKKKILIGFTIGDFYPETFEYKSGAKQGQTGISLKSHLLRISWAKVDGSIVYREPPKAPSETAETPADGSDDLPF